MFPLNANWHPDKVCLQYSLLYNKSFFFLLLLQETTHMPSYLQQIDPTTRPQPFIIELFSSSKLRPQQTFTVIEKECIPHKSLIDAVDVCYKAHFIIDCAYQSNVEGTWLFFQKMIYEQDDKRIRDTPALSSFRAYLFSKKT